MAVLLSLTCCWCSFCCYHCFLRLCCCSSADAAASAVDSGGLCVSPPHRAPPSLSRSKQIVAEALIIDCLNNICQLQRRPTPSLLLLLLRLICPCYCCKDAIARCRRCNDVVIDELAQQTMASDPSFRLQPLTETVV